MTPQQYHDGTKHHFNRFADSLGYLDWASQPAPFRSFAGAPVLPLEPAPGGTAPAIGDVLRHSLGLSAWKQHGRSRWSLRVNPSSGNLHPTEAYVVAGPSLGPAPLAAVYHYAPDRHALEQRSTFDPRAWDAAARDPERTWLVALTSIHWREAWKYGERAFRYCQHDLGHAIAAIRIAAALAGWRAVLVADWSHEQIAGLTGADRDADFFEAEREEPACLMAIVHESSAAHDPLSISPALVEAARHGCWTGRANQLSEGHVEWRFIEDIATETIYEGPGGSRASGDSRTSPRNPLSLPNLPNLRNLILSRRSALAFDGRTSTDRDTFLAMLEGVMPGHSTPWDALWWTPSIHLALFVHRVEAVDPGLYLLVRHSASLDALKAACGRDFLWQRVDDRLPLYLLARGDCRRLAERLSCDQAIAADGFFSLGMLAEFDRVLSEHGPWFYRHLFWESGVIGQVLYLQAEAAGARSTGIGCFYDDPVHEVLGLAGHAFQSLYHFTVGNPVEDTRLTTEPGYSWERSGVS